MFNFSPKMSIRKYPIFFEVGATLSMLMFQIFTDISLLKIKNFEYSYLYKKNKLY